MNAKQKKALEEFARTHNFLRQKGALCVALVGTRKAIEHTLPLNPDELRTPRKGQISGLSRDAVQKILAEYGIEKVLAREGGRTSRGSLDNMAKYIEFLNEQTKIAALDLKQVEAYWIDQVLAYFASKPFLLNLDQASSITETVQNVIQQAISRQQQYASGTQYLGAVLQHLTGAKLEILKRGYKLSHHSFSSADQQLERAGDFSLGDSVIHVSSAPTEALLRICGENLKAGLRPIIVTLAKNVRVAEALAENIQLEKRIDFFSIEQFMAVNIHEMGQFNADGRIQAINKIIEHYNKIIEENETDPSLRIKIV